MIEPNVRAILLDIEGTTSSIAFVYDVMFPYVRRQVARFLNEHWARADVQAAIDQMIRDTAGHQPADIRFDSVQVVSRHVLELMDRDSKTTGLKALQGLIWDEGFRSGELRSHLFEDCFPACQRWKAAGLTLAIYSSGSVIAQKLFFGHTEHGDLRPFFAAHFDTTVGPKREADSYRRIACELNLAPEHILFLSDVAAEIEAAQAAGLQALAVVRPGNAPLPDDYLGGRIASFAELDMC